MENTAGMQSYIFIASILCGGLVCFLYDLFRIYRYLKRPNKLVIGVQDIVFWIIAAVLAFLCSLSINSGEVRFYELLGLAIGGGLYRLILSNFMMKVVAVIIFSVRKIITFIVRVVVTPLMFVYRIISRPCVFIATISMKRFRKVRRRSMASYNYFLKIVKKM